MKQLLKDLKHEQNLKKEMISLYEDNPDPQVKLKVEWLWDDLEILNNRVNLLEKGETKV